MVRKTDRQDPTADVAAFYDGLASAYDLMTVPGKRFVQERPFFRMLVERHAIQTAIDAGCGTGFHSLLLAQLGVRVTAVDVSPEMLARVSGAARAAKLDIAVLRSSLLELPAKTATPVDAVVCMGNTLAHLLTRAALEETLRGFASILRPGGMLFLQVLNYDSILSRRERIQNVREEQGVTFVRFYDFGEELLRFNILRLERKGELILPQLSSIDLRPVLRDELDGLLASAGFVDRRTYGDISMQPFEASSRDLLVLAAREAGGMSER